MELRAEVIAGVVTRFS